MSDDTEGTLINFPTPDDAVDNPPEVPDLGRAFAGQRGESDSDSEGDTVPDFRLPDIARPMNPEDAITVSNSEGFDAGNSGDSISGGDEEGQFEGADGEYVAPRSLSDRLGDWIEYRVHRARSRHDAEAPYRDAAVAHKVKMLEAKSGRQVGAIQNSGKLDQAKLKAAADLAAARGKAQADTAKTNSASGLFGGGSKGRGGAGGPGGGSQPRTQKPQPKPQQTPAKTQTPNKPQPPKQQPARQQPSKVRDNKPNTPGDKRTQKQKDAAKANEERRRNQDRARKDQQTGGKAPGKGTDQKNGGRGTGTKAGDQTRGKKTDGTGSSLTRRDGKKDGAAPKKVNLRKDTGTDKTGTTKTDKGASGGRGSGGAAGGLKRVNLTKEKASDRPWKDPGRSGKDKPKNGPEWPSGGSKKQSAAGESRGPGKASSGPSAASGKGSESGAADGSRRTAGDTRTPGSDDSKGGRWHSWQDWAKQQAADAAGRRRDRKARGEETPAGPVPADSVGITVERTDRPTPTKRNPPRPDGPRGLAPNRPGLPPAPEPHTQRPGTTRTSSKEKPMASGTDTATAPTTTTTVNGQEALAAEHRTDITFDEYLQEIARIAGATGTNKERAEGLAHGLGKVADALRDMSSDLIGDHNIDRRVTDLVSNLADAAGRMKLQAEHAATECGTAFHAALIVGQSVARTYGQDMQAKEDAGLTHTSGAAHH